MENGTMSIYTYDDNMELYMMCVDKQNNVFKTISNLSKNNMC
jgi:hypothetical protein